MLNDIRLHLDSDETKQSLLEQACAKDIAHKQRENAKAFAQFIPTIGNALAKIPFERLSVFVDKHKQINIVDFNSGNTLYGLNVDATIEAQVQAWPFTCALLNLPTTSQGTLKQQRVNEFCERKAYAKKLQVDCNTLPIDTLVVLGLGKATHLSLLLDSTNNATLLTSNLKHLVIYEADWEIFRCSLACFDWASFLAQAQRTGLQLFLQIGSPIEQLFTDISELHQQLGADRILFYQHLNHAVYANIINNLRAGIWGHAVTEAADESRHKSSPHQHHHLLPFSALNADKWFQVTSSNTRFSHNMSLFAEYFPDIHNAFKDYKPTCWDTLSNQDQSAISLYNLRNGACFSGLYAQQEGQQLAEHYARYPNLDGLIFGHSGDKLKHYLHNTFIRQADMILRANVQQQGELPSSVKVLMMFGLGSGYMLESLFTSHDIQNLIICEPNPDFFYASLYAIDWSPIIEKYQQGEHKLYINIGEASSRLFKDLMSQFLVLGPHLLNETFIMQAYYNPLLHQVLSEVRQQLKVIFAMGENFDHVAYGIAHTVEALSQKRPALRFEPQQYLSRQHKQTPIFFIGNGPSLDDSIEIIKEYREQVIVVSCGTALQALYKNNIRPDFHGEVEQNRANFDWASRIGDRDYLKKITLLSVNGIHPDTCRLYKDVLFAFKAGESSSHSILAMLPPHSFHMLNHAYPTVTNMAMSFFLSLGFEQLYLVGVDLGFADQEKHHSSASGYYENGKQLYDYKNAHATDLRVRGNRQNWVFTKTEFNISRMIIEQLLIEAQSKQHQHIECFNLSNGVFIEGSVSLDPEAVLVMSSKRQKADTLKAMDTCFMTLESDVPTMLKQAYNDDLLSSQMIALNSLTTIRLLQKVQIQELVDHLREIIHEAKRVGKSLFFYYFFNSVNYLSAALNKASLQNNEKLAVQDANLLLQKWALFMQDAQSVIAHQLSIIDTAEAFSDRREKSLLPLLSNKGKLSYFVFNRNVQTSMSLNIAADNNICCELLDNIRALTHHITEQMIKKSDSPLIIDIHSQKDAKQTFRIFSRVIEDIKDSQQGKHTLVLNIGLLFHNMALLRQFQIQYPQLVKRLCLLYSSPAKSSMTDLANVYKGSQDVLQNEEYLHSLVSRAQDLKRFAFILIKPKFSENGLKNAIETSSNHEKESLRETAPLIAGQNTGEVVHPERVNVPNNEYESIAVNIIDKQIIEYFNYAEYYMFKHYLAVTKDKAECTESSITILDSLENRGLKTSRKPMGFELLSAWYAPETLIPN